jgi:ribokinase
MKPMPPLVSVFGSLHYDITVHGPDRPRKGETVTGQSWRPKCGGKGGNQAVAAARAGARVAMIGAVGDDDFGETLLANLDRKDVDRRFVRIAPGVGSGMSVAIFDAQGDYGAVIVSGANLTLSNKDMVGAAEVFAEASVLVLQNEVPDLANVAAARAARAAGARIILNAAPARIPSGALMDLIDILVVNAIEAETLANMPVVDSLDGALAAARALTALCPVAIVTAGGDGLALADRDGNTICLPAETIKVESTHGAGDEFVGALAAALAGGSTFEAALRAANHAAAVLVSTPEELRQ